MEREREREIERNGPNPEGIEEKVAEAKMGKWREGVCWLMGLRERIRKKKKKKKLRGKGRKVYVMLKKMEPG